MKEPLVFSIAFDGYQWLHEQNRLTQAEYCRCHGYNYVFVNRPAFTRLGRESTWLKIVLLISAIMDDREWALYLDADIEAKPGAPAIDEVLQPGKSIYMANGFSGRPNAGVILARGKDALPSLRAVLNGILVDLPNDDRVGWGDNGHVIHFTKAFPGRAELPCEWNNTNDPARADFFRHYSTDRMPYSPTSFRAKLVNRLLTYRKWRRLLKRPDLPTHEIPRLLARLSDSVHSRYPDFTPKRFDEICGRDIASIG